MTVKALKKKNNMAFKMKAGKEGPMKKNFPSAFKKEEAQRLLDAVPNKAAYDKLSPQAKATFDKAAKKYGLPTKKA